jgi:hypothetical protein
MIVNVSSDAKLCSAAASLLLIVQLLGSLVARPLAGHAGFVSAIAAALPTLDAREQGRLLQMLRLLTSAGPTAAKALNKCTVLTTQLQRMSSRPAAGGEAEWNVAAEVLTAIRDATDDL